MKPRSFIFIGFCAVLLVAAACRKDYLPVKEFFWEGHLYRGMTDEPLANQRLQLEGHSFRNFSMRPVLRFTEVTITDANGWFRIPFPKIDRAGEANLQEGEGIILYALDETGRRRNITEYYPWNRDYQLDVPEHYHSRLRMQFEINTIPFPDTLYLFYDQAADDAFNQKMTIDSLNHNYLYHIKAIPLTSTPLTYNCKQWLEANWSKDQNPDFALYYGTSLQDLKNALMSNQIDSIPDDYNRVIFKPTGYSEIDEISVVVE